MSVGSVSQDLIEVLRSFFFFVRQSDVQSFEMEWDLSRALSNHSWDNFPQKIDESTQHWITRSLFQSLAEINISDAEDLMPTT
jgi:hypothetical protein